MMLRETASVLIILGLIALAGGGYVVSKELSEEGFHSDGFIEEATESIVENILEEHLGLDDDALKDKIDFTFWDDEEETQLQEELILQNDL